MHGSLCSTILCEKETCNAPAPVCYLAAKSQKTKASPKYAQSCSMNPGNRGAMTLGMADLGPAADLLGPLGPRAHRSGRSSRAQDKEGEMLTCVKPARRLEGNRRRFDGHQGVVFAQRAHSTNYYVVYPGNTPENHPPTEACMIHSKQHRVQNSGPWDPWLPVVKNSRLFAQRAQRTVRPLGLSLGNGP